MMDGFFKRRDKAKISAERLKEIISVLNKREVVHGITPEKLRNIFEDLGPMFVKLGQIMSMRTDILPQEFCDELMKLQAEAKPLPYEQILDVIQSEYRQPISDIFTKIYPNPMGSASIAQVHAALLKDGRKVVIKVQRPGVYDIMMQDIMLLKRAAKILQIISDSSSVVNFNSIVDEMWAVAKQEMDFLIEARNNEEFMNFNRDVEYVSCPIVEKNLTTSHIMVMEYIDGIAIDDTDKIRAAGWDIDEIGRKLGENYMKQIVEDGFFHADPHPGNIWIRGGDIVWLDMGMMGRLSKYDRSLFNKAIMALANNDAYTMEDVVLSLGKSKKRVDHVLLYTDIDEMMTRYTNMDFGNIDIGEVIRSILDIAQKHQITIAPGIGILGRGTVILGCVLKKYCPNVSMIEILTERVKQEFKFNVKDEILKLQRLVYRVSHKAVDIPGQLSDILKMTLKGQTKVNLDLTGCEEPLKQMNRMINKLVICIISAALLLGSSIISTTQMSPQIMGIPLLGFLGYMAAILLCIKLLFSIMKN
jgi:ubiquinone biosynthesis protein